MTKAMVAVRALLAAVLLLPAFTVAGARGAERFQVLEVVRSSRATSRSVAFTVEFTSIHPRGFYGVFALATGNGATALASAATVEHGAPEPTVFVAPGLTVPRSPVRFTSGDVYAHTLSVDPGTRVFVVSEAASVEVGVPRGWTVRRAALGVRRLVADDVSTGASTPVYGVEQFAGPVTLPGGRYGSVAWAGIPCARIPYPDPVVGAGAGTATLSGGASPVTLHCLANSAITSHSRPTTWTLDGSVRGLSDVITRLFVLDFPKP